jgi:hypothetical protein
VATGAVVVVALVASLLTTDHFKVAGFTTPGSQSVRALDQLHRALGYDPLPGLMILAHAPLPSSS